MHAMVPLMLSALLLLIAALLLPMGIVPARRFSLPEPEAAFGALPAAFAWFPVRRRAAFALPPARAPCGRASPFTLRAPPTVPARCRTNPPGRVPGC